VFRAALARGELRLQRCTACGRAIFYPRLLCHYCGSIELEWFAPSGRGRVHSTSTVRPWKGASEAYDVSLVDLEEGARLLSRVVEVAPGEVAIGMEVEAFVGELGGEPVVLFRPLRRAGA
jgi:uncharacterized OB-fold protein